MKSYQVKILLLYLQFNLASNSILIDKFDSNIGYISLAYYKNNNKYICLNYYDNTFHYLKKYDKKENIIQEEKAEYNKEKITELLYFHNTDNYVAIINSEEYYEKSVNVFYNNKINKLKLDKYSDILGFTICGDNTLILVIENFSSKRKFLLYNYPPKIEPDFTFTEDNLSSYSSILLLGLQNTFMTLSYEDENDKNKLNF